jgi:hypothetical protein
MLPPKETQSCNHVNSYRLPMMRSRRGARLPQLARGTYVRYCGHDQEHRVAGRGRIV